MRKILLASGVLLTLIVACSESKYSDGQRLYENNCAQCHMSNGSGLGDAIPALDAERLLYRKEDLPCIIQNGIKGQLMVMPAHPHLNDVEISNIIHFLFDKFTESPQQIPIGEIKNQLLQCEKI